MLPDQAALLRLFRLDEETGKLYWLPRPDNPKWTAAWAGKEALTAVARKGYKQGAIFGQNCKAHRVVFKMVHGFEPEHVDHINRDVSDNRPCNLRAATLMENAQNRGITVNNRSGVLGVCFDRGRWIAQIRRNGRVVYRARFGTLEEAAAAREVALQTL